MADSLPNVCYLGSPQPFKNATRKGGVFLYRPRMVLKRSRNLAIGTFGESRIVDFCTQRGDEILDRNWRVREGEIDIVSMGSDGIIHFIEVKTRSSLAYGDPFEAITPPKLLRMQRLAMGWLVTHDCFGCEFQIDIASVLLSSDGGYTIEYRGGVL